MPCADRRVRFLEYEDDPAGHLARLSQFDIALDPPKYTGTVTTLECLYAGVPVVTLEGQLHRSRVSASLLRAAGLEDLVAANEQEYVDKAARLAESPLQLAGYRQCLRQKVEESPMMDHAGFARDFEQAVLGAWRQTNTYLKLLKPRAAATPKAA